jgi:hypothetical protein
MDVYTQAVAPAKHAVLAGVRDCGEPKAYLPGFAPSLLVQRA